MSARGRVLVIAGSDSGGGAGIQADIKTVMALGGYATTAITAITAQNTLGVFGVHPIPAEMVLAQGQVVLSDIGTDAVKTGMLASAEVIEAAAALIDEAGAPAVIDPVMVATTDDLRRAGEALLRAGARAVLMKGGHIDGETLTDVLMTSRGETTFSGPRLETRNTHGTGCTLASACAAGLAQGLALEDAVARAWAFVAEAIRRAPDLGAGAGPLDHGWMLREET